MATTKGDSRRVTVQVFADQASFDRVYYNWFELQFRRRYDAFPGHIALPETSSTGRRIPAYVLLMGDATYDYRNIIGGDIGGGRPSFVPSQYYQARERGHSSSDYLYTLVDGDDRLPDLALGRLQWRVPSRPIKPSTADWRSRVIYLANYHAKGIFSEPSDALAENYTQPFGLESVKIYNPDDSDVPNATGGAYLEALNEGALLVNFAGHGSADFMRGRLIRRLGPQRMSAGFSQTKWDGRGDDGRQLANGTYLCRIRARDEGGSAVEHRAPFVITR